MRVEQTFAVAAPLEVVFDYGPAHGAPVPRLPERLRRNIERAVSATPGP